MPDWDVCVEPTRLLCDALWHDLGMAVRSQRRMGRFRNSIDDSMCLVVDAQVLGEPDPDLTRDWTTDYDVRPRDANGAESDGGVRLWLEVDG